MCARTRRHLHGTAPPILLITLTLILWAGPAGATTAAPFLSASVRSEVDLSGPGWFLWRDTNAAWQTEELFAPPVDISSVPVHPPTGGWSELVPSNAIPVAVPGTAEEYFGDGTGPDTDVVGVTWWFRTIRIPEKGGARLRLRFEATRQRAEVYLDRKLVGYDLVGNTPFEVDLSALASPGQQCQLAVRITDPGGNFDWRDSSAIKWGTHLIPASHGFGGITGGVKLIACNPVYVDDLYVQNTPAIREINAIATVRNSSGAEVQRDVLVRVIDPRNPAVEVARRELWSVKLTPGDNKVSCALSAPEARLWDLQHPNLYRCKVELQSDGRTTDAQGCNFGFRWFAPEGIGRDAVFRLNGKRIVVRTAISWGFFPINGIFPTPELAAKQVRVARELGLNMLTFHRCIGSPLILDQADEQGLLYYEEPGGYKSAEKDPFAESLMREKMLRMVRRDRSHPSLVIFSLINERNPKQPLLPSEKDDLLAAHALDPSRILTLSSSWASSFGDEEVAKTHLRPFDQQIYFKGWWDFHRAGGPEVWREEFSPTNNLGYTTDKEEIVFRGEEGAVSSPPRLELMRKELQQSPRPGWDSAVYLDWYDAFAGFIKRKHLEDAFPTVDSLTTAMGAVSHYNQGRRIEDHRICNLNDGYAVNGWESEVIENHSGIVDCYRNPKADPAILAYYNQPLYVAVKIRKPFVQIPGRVTADFYLVNEEDVQGRKRLKIDAKTPAGRVVFKKEIPVDVLGGDTFGQALAEGVDIPVSGATGLLRVEAALMDSTGREQASGHDEFLAVDWKSANIPGKGAVCEWGDTVSEFLRKDKGIKVPAFNDRQGRLDWIVVARAPYEQPQVIADRYFVDAAGQPAPLTTTFFAGRDLSRKLHQRTDPQVDFRWANGSTPDPAVNLTTDYGIRFEGWVMPPRTGEYTFVTRSSQLARLRVNGRELIDAWDDRSRPDNQGTILLEAGKPVRIRLDYYNKRSNAYLQLLWAPPATSALDPERLFARARQDGTTLLFVDYVDTWMDLIQKHASLKYNGTFDIGTAWLGGQYFVRRHPLFKDLPVNQAMNWEYQKLVQRGRNRYGLRVEGEDLVAGCYQSTPFELGTAVGLVPCGKGRILFSTLAVCANLASRDPAAEVARKVLCNYLEYAGGNSGAAR